MNKQPGYEERNADEGAPKARVSTKAVQGASGHQRVSRRSAEDTKEKLHARAMTLSLEPQLPPNHSAVSPKSPKKFKDPKSLGMETKPKKSEVLDPLAKKRERPNLIVPVPQLRAGKQPARATVNQEAPSESYESLAAEKQTGSLDLTFLSEWVARDTDQDEKRSLSFFSVGMTKGKSVEKEEIIKPPALTSSGWILSQGDGHESQGQPLTETNEHLLDSFRDSIAPLPVATTANRRQESQPGAQAVQGLLPLGLQPGGFHGSRSNLTNVSPSEPPSGSASERIEASQSTAHHGLAEAEPVTEARFPRAEEYEQDGQSTIRRRQKNLLTARRSTLLGLVLLLLVVVPIAVKISNEAGDVGQTNANTTRASNPTLSPSISRDGQFLNLLPQQTVEAIQYRNESPQAKAFEWLRNDSAMVNLSDTRMIQRFALATIFYATGGRVWINHSGWLSYSVHECQWHNRAIDLGEGACVGAMSIANIDEDLNLTHLWLPYNNLQGQLPYELYLLTSLASINTVANPQLQWAITSSIALLPKLEVLQMGSQDGLTGFLPTQLGLMRNLKDLYLAHGSLTGSVPTEMGLLTALDFLFLDSNQLSSSLPTELGNLSNLIHLYLFNNLHTGALPSELGMLTRLEQMSLDGNMLSSSIPTQFGLLLSMTDFVPKLNQLSGPLPSELGALPSLKYIALLGNQLSGPIPSELGASPSLEDLRLSLNQLSGSIPPQLFNASSLYVLDLKGNSLSSSLPTEVSQALNLTYFFAGDNLIRGDLPSELGLLPKLKLWTLNNNVNITGTLPSQLGQLSSLQAAWLSGTSLSGTIPSELGGLVVAGNLLHLDIQSNTSKLSGTVPNALCQPNANATSTCPSYLPCGTVPVKFDCKPSNESGLCGCDCPCDPGSNDSSHLL